MHRNQSFFDKKAATWEQDNPVSEENLKKVISFCKLRQGFRIVDVGTGTGRLIPFILEKIGSNGEVVGIDPSSQMLKYASEKHQQDNVQFKHLRIEDANFDNGSFDRAICYAVFPHFSDKDKAISQLHRILQPGGLLTIAHTKGREHINKTHETAGKAVANDLLISARNLGDLLQKHGFEVKQMIDAEDFYVVCAEKTGDEK